jgi:hypothetical protein
MFSDNVAIFLLITHGIVAVFTLGALTHQVISLTWAPKGAGQAGFVTSLRAVRAAHYTNAIIVLYVITAILGGLIYVNYRIEVRQFYLDQYKMYKSNGLFEMKEHLIAMGLGLLPAYWYYWKQELKPEIAKVRTVLSAYLAFAVWFSFLVGHWLNNIQGFGK